MLGDRIIQEAYQVPLKGKGSRLLLFQDWPADLADRSKEGALALRLIAASFRTPRWRLGRGRAIQCPSR